MFTYKSFIKLALKNGNTISVWDGEEWGVKKSTDYNIIKEMIEAVEESQIVIRDSSGNRLGWALIIPVESEEDIADYSDNEYMNNLYEEWSN